MAKRPVAGRVKTRLARGVGIAEALRFYRTASTAVIGRLARQPFWETILAVAPDAERSARVWPGDVMRIGQGGGDLGRRMQHPMRILPPGPVCVVGTDVPGIDVAAVRRAFRGLGRHDAVFGPAADGGFWLVGLRRRPRLIEPYAGTIRWSSTDALADVLAGLEGCSIGFTETLADVDDAADLANTAGTAGRRVRRRAP